MIIQQEKEVLLKFIREEGCKYVDIDLVDSAINFAAKAHENQLRASGEPYITHPIAVATLLVELRLDQSSIIAALLHDVVENSDCSLETISENFGQKIAELVDGVTKLSRIAVANQSENARQVENLRKLFLALSKDVRVLLIKLADRLHNMRTINFFASEKKRIRIAQETMDIYASLAERIGLHKFKTELQNLAFAQLHPTIYESIVNRLTFLRDNGSINIEAMISTLTDLLIKHGLKAKIIGREKSAYSIWKKMEAKTVSFEQLSDIVAFRIVPDNIEDCYKVLGILHTTYRAIPGSFNDYISMPKPNSYKSLHTVILGPQQHCAEIQIRTTEMEEVAELGLAAHWTYKQGSEYDENFLKHRQWIEQLQEILKNTGGPTEVLENTRREIEYNQIFCFTPKGEVIALPKFATAIDFAFALHSEIGLHCMGVKINNKLCPLQMHIVSGDQVEILTSTTETAEEYWLDIAVTGKARHHINQFLNTKKQDDFISRGKSLISKAFEKIGIKYDESIIMKTLEALKKNTVSDLFEAIGKKELHPGDVLREISKNNPNKSYRKHLSKLLEKHVGKSEASTPRNDTEDLGRLLEGKEVCFAKCCYPVPGDEIVAVEVSQQREVVHAINCKKLGDKLHPIRWGEDSQKVYTGCLEVTIFDTAGALSGVVQRITDVGVDILNLKITRRQNNFADIRIEVQTRGVTQLQNILTLLNSSSNVYSAKGFEEGPNP